MPTEHSGSRPGLVMLTVPAGSTVASLRTGRGPRTLTVPACDRTVHVLRSTSSSSSVQPRRAAKARTRKHDPSSSDDVPPRRRHGSGKDNVLFELARFHAPSTILLDELDGVSHRIELYLRGSGPSGELDHAMLRRLEKRILVDLPTKEARHAMVQFHLPRTINQGTGVEITTDLDYEHLAEDSSLCRAEIHSGKLQDGTGGFVTVNKQPMGMIFPGSTRNRAKSTFIVIHSKRLPKGDLKSFVVRRYDLCK
ncbi:KATNAL2 [Branchiostoma lanceolatum]|uniref:KATNAL2 protein n=1 Tax=Branchiostoma lanceolatum TaxID=7740 RepID=A0A8K0EJ53_BRALA|nr:KATNAL2 [Branchiostoma lanceolatum]